MRKLRLGKGKYIDTVIQVSSALRREPNLCSKPTLFSRPYTSEKSNLSAKMLGNWNDFDFLDLLCQAWLLNLPQLLVARFIHFLYCVSHFAAQRGPVVCMELSWTLQAHCLALLVLGQWLHHFLQPVLFCFWIGFALPIRLYAHG